MNIVKVKYIEKTLNWVSIKFEDGTEGQSSLLDGVRRQYTDIVNVWLEDNTPEPMDVRVLTYQELRVSEYPPMEDFADAWVKNDVEAMEKYKAYCLAVKAKYPKESNEILI